VAKIFHFIRKVAGLYNAEKLLMCGAQFVRTHNTAGIEADTQAALRGKSTIFEVDFPVVVLTWLYCALTRAPCQRTLHWREHRLLRSRLCPYGVSLNLNVRHQFLRNPAQ
jgi:hypothetical protein